MLQTLLDYFDEWAKDKTWYLRSIILVIMLFLTFQMCGREGYHSWFSGINLGIHEIGHLVFRFGGEVICAFGGTLLQCLAPLIAIVVFLKTPDLTAIPFAMTWLASNLLNVSYYIADASKMALHLVTPGGGEASHDWNFLLGKFGLLGKERFISGCVSFLGFIVMIAAILLQAWMIFRIYQINKEKNK